jgi:ADP-ribose pyrophosphatase YjhB (NUDIX family)
MNSLTSAVGAIITDESGRVLLCQQRHGHRLWGLPGGKIRTDESPIHAVIRDIREETGCETEIDDLVGMYQLTGNGCGDDLPDVITYVFRGHLSASDVAVNSPRIARLAWYSPDALPQPLTATTRIALAHSVTGRSGVVCSVERDREPEVPDAVDPLEQVAAPEPIPA